ncbi:Pickpocket protein 28 [Gryllus bimaculatus]|nr:Pickpocket protein 28 [Gryllus bimaculatus]
MPQPRGRARAREAGAGACLGRGKRKASGAAMWSVSRRLPPAEAAPSVELAGRLSPRSADRVRAQRLSSLRVRAQRRRLRGFRLRVVGSHLAQFANDTTMHGLRYLAEPRRPWHERLLWAASVLLALGACATLVAQTWVRWRAAPIIVALDEGSRPIWNVPFPAVTVCPINKINASKFNFSDVSRRALQDNATDEEKLKLSEILTLCDITNENLTSTEERDIVALIEEVRLYFPVYCYINQTIIGPEFRRKGIAGLFRPLITEDGLCYTFNMLDRSEFFVNGTVFMSRNYLNYGLNSTEWSPVDGYSEDSDENSYPFRTTATGRAAGLSFRLDVSLCHMDSDCRDALEGHTITVHSPLEFPRPQRSAVRLPLAGGAKVSVEPLLIATDDDLEKEYSVEQRQCYFPHERRLGFFRHYTQLMCETECLANFTLRFCGCVLTILLCAAHR